MKSNNHNEKNNKTCRLIIRLTFEEKQLIKKKADSVGMTISKFIRKISLDENAVFFPIEDQKEFQELLLNSFEIKRTLNLYHEKRTEVLPFLSRFSKFIKKLK